MRRRRGERGNFLSLDRVGMAAQGDRTMKEPWLSILVLLTAACGGSSPPPDTAPPAHDQGTGTATERGEPTEPGRTGGQSTDLASAEKDAYERARPVFEKYCSKCHSRGGAKAKAKTLEHFDMTSYPLGGHHAAEITAVLRAVLGIGGGKATMPMDNPGSVKGDELDLIAAWADAYDKAHEGDAHDHGEGEHHGDGNHGDRQQQHSRLK
jgi:hypothetical protein